MAQYDSKPDPTAAVAVMRLSGGPRLGDEYAILMAAGQTILFGGSGAKERALALVSRERLRIVGADELARVRETYRGDADLDSLTRAPVGIEDPETLEWKAAARLEAPLRRRASARSLVAWAALTRRFAYRPEVVVALLRAITLVRTQYLRQSPGGRPIEWFAVACDILDGRRPLDPADFQEALTRKLLRG